MIVLAFDAALDGFSLALDLNGDQRTYASHRPDALEGGLGAIDTLLRDAGLRLRDVDRIAVGLGPGSFTGARIAVSFAKALAQATGVPLVGVSSYDALEPADAPLPMLAVVRGRIGVICARLRADGEPAAVACGPVDSAVQALLHGTSGVLHVAGATEDVLAAIAERGLTVRVHSPRSPLPAVAIAELARTAEPASSPHALAPDYGEAPAARIPPS